MLLYYTVTRCSNVKRSFFENDFKFPTAVNLRKYLTLPQKNPFLLYYPVTRCQCSKVKRTFLKIISDCCQSKQMSCTCTQIKMLLSLYTSAPISGLSCIIRAIWPIRQLYLTCGVSEKKLPTKNHLLLYYTVTRCSQVKRSFFESDFKFPTAVNLNKCLTQIKMLFFFYKRAHLFLGYHLL